MCKLDMDLTVRVERDIRQGNTQIIHFEKLEECLKGQYRALPQCNKGLCSLDTKEIMKCLQVKDTIDVTEQYRVIFGKG